MTIPDEHIGAILKALEAHVAYLSAQNRDDRPALAALEAVRLAMPKSRK